MTPEERSKRANIAFVVFVVAALLAFFSLINPTDSAPRRSSQSAPRATSTATHSPTPAGTATNTPIPTETAIPTETPIPTHTPIPTPTATPIPPTMAGTILNPDQTWFGDGLKVTLFITHAEPAYVTFVIQVENTSGERLDIRLPKNALLIIDDNDTNWDRPLDSVVINDTRLTLLAGEEVDLRISFWNPVRALNRDSYQANVYVTLNGWGSISKAQWGFTWDKGRVLPLP